MYDSPSLSTQWSLAIKKKKESNKDGTGKGESAGFSNMSTEPLILLRCCFCSSLLKYFLNRIVQKNENILECTKPELLLSLFLLIYLCPWMTKYFNMQCSGITLYDPYAGISEKRPHEVGWARTVGRSWLVSSFVLKQISLFNKLLPLSNETELYIWALYKERRE